MIERSSPPQRLFNTPLECGFRLLIILNAVSKEPDLQRLVSYDYLLVHSGDVKGGPPSMHPAVPFRSSEFLVKRDVIRLGLDHMFSRELIDKRMTQCGILYAGTDLTRAFVSLLKSNYAEALKQRAHWLADRFGETSDQRLSEFMADNVGRWGAEFDHLAALRDLEL